MKFTVNRDVMLDALAKVQSIVSSRTSIPVLSNVLLSAGDGELTLSTTDLEISVRAVLPAKVTRKGASTLPAKRLFSVIRELPSFDMEIEVDAKHTAAIRCGTSFFKILGLAADDFPQIPDPDGDHVFSLDQGAFKNMLRSVQYAASVDETRQVLNGALLSFANKKLTVVATDGRRLAMIENEVEFPEGADKDLVLPSKTVHELIRNLADEGPLTLTTAGNQVAFDLEGMRLVSKMIDGNFPNFRQVIPAACTERVTIERETLLTAIRRVALVTSEQSNSVKMVFSENALEVVAITPDVGEASEIIPVKYSGEKLTVAFNPEFMMAPLKVLDRDEVFFELTDELSPGVLKSDISFLYVIMPMRVQ